MPSNPANPDRLVPLSPCQRASSLPAWSFVVLPATWFLTLRLLLTHDPLAHAIRLGADLAKEHALKAIPQEWMGWLAQPVIQVINQYAGPYAALGEAFMGTWGLLLTVVFPAAFLLLGFGLVHGVLLLGGAPGGWRATARAFLLNHAIADLATLAWAWLILVFPAALLTKVIWLLLGLLFIRFVAQVWLLASLVRTHALGALRIILLGIPALLLSTAVSWFIATALWAWLTSDLALSALR